MSLRPGAATGRRPSVAAATAVLAATVAISATLAGCTSGPPAATATTAAPLTAAPLATLPTPAGSALALSVARRFVFRARNSTCLATGTAFAFDGAIVTNRHVAAGAASLGLATWDGQDFHATVSGHSVSADLARLQATVPGGFTTATAGAADPTVGTAVYVTGYPLGDQLTATSGTVVAVTTVSGLGVSGPVLELSDKVQPGNSGSPLLDGAGQVVGVVFAIDTANGDGLAMPLSTLRGFLAATAHRSALPCTSQ